MGLTSVLFGQTGTIRGKVIDGDFGDGLIGATVVVSGTTNGSVTDIEGSFSIGNLPTGSYDLEASFVGYEMKKITGVEVITGEISVINITLGGTTEELEEVVITAEALRNSEAGVLTAQKKALQVVDGMGAEQFARGGDNNAASAIKRITGVSVEGGKYVYVRGLGDRYSKTNLNGADIPGLDPNRNTVQMDLFPANLIDNIMVYKTFSPNLPGDFTGGFVNVETKDFPDRFTLQFSNSFSFNTQANFNDEFLSTQGGSTDYLGMDDGSRDIPEVILNNAVPVNGGANDSERALLNQMGNSFGLMQMAPFQNSRFLNQSHSLSIGNQKVLFGKSFGFIGGLSYNRGYSHYSNGSTGRYSLPGVGSTSLNTELSLNDTRSAESVLWGAFANLSLKLTDNNKLSFNMMRNQSSDNIARSQSGSKPLDDPELNYETRAIMYVERSITSAQLKGEHFLGGAGRATLDWISSYTVSSQEEPDLKFFTFGTRERIGGGTIYQIQPSIGQLPSRYYRDMTESHFDNKVNFSLPIGEEDKAGSIKAGLSYVIKDRGFREFQYRYNSNPTPPDYFNGDINAYVSSQLATSDNPRGTYIFDAFDDGNNYDADQTIAAAYGMIEKNIGEKLRLVAGARVETTELEIISFDEDDEPGSLDNVDVLPALSFTYALNDNMNVKGGYSKTLARPTFRELAPYTSFDFIGDYLLAGNTQLERTSISNLDIRWEYYSRPGELFAFSTFYKDFTNPIEKTFNVNAANGNELTWRNTPRARILGIEAEFRKRLDFIIQSLQNFTIGANFTYVKSEVDIDQAELGIIRAFDPDAPATRQMFGQSPYIVNTFISYDNFEGFTSNLTFYVNGDRLSVVTAGGAPNVIEKARPTLNFNLSKRVGKFDLKFSANNLLNPEFKFVQDFLGEDNIFQNSTMGQTFKLGFSYRVD